MRRIKATARIQPPNRWSFSQSVAHSSNFFRPSHFSFIIMSQRFANYVVYKITGGDALIKSGRTAIYEHPADQTTFYACNDSHLIDTTWIYKMSWENTTDTAQTYTLDYVTGPKEAEAADIPKSWNCGFLPGLSITMNTQAKVFSDSETTDSDTKSVSLTIPANSTLTFYQKKYWFRNSMFFVLDTLGQEFNVGSPGGDDVLR
ncbi:uncharacterized protein EV420DRAFT_302670 [Desarmillaria tabescens]|uniref:Uncharacterized protein n=1 Tax=Armillaria tabescens TaxID=1929756 RepID=A0AA39KDD0_ARMTA|nr:uncharacterized protein EV420DRAFT_302670 [Desarmillaria tabescens]KAK0459089.1 hypothetical protein EV420DRAFT_302670 [Desarmillaria tabescens]